MRGGVASSRRAQAAERREEAWRLRKRGYSFQQIADELRPTFSNYSKSTAERDIKRVLEEINARTLETAAEARALDLARLDDLLTAWFATALRENERATVAGEKSADQSADGLTIDPAGDSAESGAAGEKAESDASIWSALDPLETLEAALKEAMLSKHAAEIVFKALEQRAKLLGLHRQEVALTTPVPLQVAADLSGLDEDSLDAIIRNLTAAIGAGGS